MPAPKKIGPYPSTPKLRPSDFTGSDTWSGPSPNRACFRQRVKPSGSAATAMFAYGAPPANAALRALDSLRCALRRSSRSQVA